MISPKRLVTECHRHTITFNDNTLLALPRCVVLSLRRLRVNPKHEAPNYPSGGALMHSIHPASHCRLARAEQASQRLDKLHPWVLSLSLTSAPVMSQPQLQMLASLPVCGFALLVCAVYLANLLLAGSGLARLPSSIQHLISCRTDYRHCSGR